MTPLTREQIASLREARDEILAGLDLPQYELTVRAILKDLPALLDIAEAVANARVAWQSPRGIIQSEVDVRFDGTDTTGWRKVAVLPLAGEVASGRM